MKSTNSKLLIGLICLVLGFILGIQIKSTFNHKVEISRQFGQLSSELDSLKKQKADVSKKFQEVNAMVNAYEKSVVETTTSAKKLKNQIDLLKLLLGYEDVHGTGIIITINPDSLTQSDDFFGLSSDDLVAIINDLNSGGAEAISINDERYTNRTKIMEAEDNTIKINDACFNVDKVFTIKAIGNPNILINRLLLGDNISGLRASGFQVNIKSFSDMMISKYSETISNKFIKSNK